MSSPAAAGNGLKFLRPKLRPQSTDIQAAAMWGVAAITSALYVIHPWDFLRKTFIEKQEEEK
ncbi:Ubiquinol-cytochrome c reductase complex 6.7 kDa protein [Capsicum annuum]|nr:Ubiquinol-cytochrome c reductase complex 6.7 kDa protein [Capsicum annuum]